MSSMSAPLCRTRRAVCALLSGLALGATLVAPAAQAAGSVKLGSTIWIGYAPLYVADQLDLYKKSGVKVTTQMYSDPGLIPAAVTGGAVDVGVITYDQVISAVAKGSTMRVVMPIDYSNGGDAIVTTVDVKSIKDFKGRKVAYNPLSPSDFLLSYALQTNGLTEKDVQPVNMSPENVAAAMASGAIKVGVTYQPSVNEIVQMDGGKKFKVIYSSKEAPGLITDVMVSKQEFIAKHPELVKAMIQGYIDGLEYMRAKPAEAAKLIGKVMGISDKEVTEQLQDVYNIPPAEFAKVFEKGTATTTLFGSGPVISKILKAKGEIKTIPKTEDTFDASLVSAMAKK
ncbi:MAG: ABC transporter substrate-binding protein [Burkholderiales bacterium]|jgi:NitT/TauT family transport system substrate-binding protein|nr:ABC transporter substrate-binding protein [Burkholderiales bacterium]